MALRAEPLGGGLATEWMGKGCWTSGCDGGEEGSWTSQQREPHASVRFPSRRLTPPPPFSRLPLSPSPSSASVLSPPSPSWFLRRGGRSGVRTPRGVRGTGGGGGRPQRRGWKRSHAAGPCHRLQAPESDAVGGSLVGLLLLVTQMLRVLIAVSCQPRAAATPACCSPFALHSLLILSPSFTHLSSSVRRQISP